MATARVGQKGKMKILHEGTDRSEKFLAGMKSASRNIGISGC